MKQTIKISSDDEVIQFADGTELLVAPLIGEATIWSRDKTASRLFDVPADEDTSLEFRRVLENLGISQQLSLHLDLEGFSNQPEFISTGEKQTITLRPSPRLLASSVQVVLFQDESGGLSWHFPNNFFKSSSVGASGLEFTIHIRALAAQDVIHQGTPFPLIPQGPITKQGRNVFKVLEISVSEKTDIIGNVERTESPYFIRSISPETYRERESKAFTGWQNLVGTRALLVIHDLFSSVAGMLSSMSVEDVAMIYDSYEGRVIGFDHPTLSESPEQNAKTLIETLSREVPEGTIDFDVLAHGRGGIVARILAERGEQLGGDRFKVRKICMAGVPTRGTPLADPKFLPDLLNVLTNLNADFAEGPELYPLPLMVAMVAQLANNPATVMPGIAAMGTEESYVEAVLNSAGPPTSLDYACISADFQPDPTVDNAFLTSTFKNELVERVFAVGNVRAQNDLLTPTESFIAYQSPAAMQNVLMFKPNEHVSHVGYFSRPETMELMRRHFDLRGKGLKGLETGANDLDKTVVGRTIDKDTGLIAGRIKPRKPRFGRRRSSVPTEFRDELEGKWDQAKGKIKETIGRAIDDDDLEAEGRAENARGKVEEALEEARRKFREIIKDVKDEKVTNQPTSGSSLDPATIGAVIDEQPAWPTWNKGTTSPAETVPRTPQIKMPESVYEGDTIEVVVSLTAWSSGGSATGPVNVLIPRAKQEVSVVVRLEASGFEFVESDEAKEIRVHRGMVSPDESVSFKLKALSPGRLPAQRRITADFWQNGTTVGWVSGNIIVNPIKEPRASKFQLIETPRRPCDLSIIIEDSKVHLQFEKRYKFKSFGQLKFKSNDLAEMIQTYISSHINVFPAGATPEALNQWKSNFVNALVTLGGKLWTFLPEEFQHEYFRLRESEDLSSIGVYSSEMVFPWELVRPYQPGTEPELTLGQLHVLGRWMTQRDSLPSPQQMKVEKIAILNPMYEDPAFVLPWSSEEVKQLCDLLPRIAEPIKPVNHANVKRFVLDSTDVHVLHFTGHGAADQMNCDLNYLMLEDQQLMAASFAQTKVGPEAHPFLILNACSVGVINEVVERPAGFPATCLDGGFSGLVAPLWPVPDRSAMDFSVELYRKLLFQKRSIGEALSELRREKPGDPTYLAYTFFGDPWARLLFS